MEKKISVIIPNFNGQTLLAKNLPKVIAACPECEIIVVDDGSTDDSVASLKKNFKKIKIIINKKNLGFVRSANIGAAAAHGDFILFLNTDVAPRTNFLESVLSHFNLRKHPRGELFAVALSDQSHENGKIVVRGRGGAKFTKGFVNHFALKPQSGETLWVSGGSGLFEREKFLELGGFDPVFAPFYWEDIDLSYRARKQGMICIFEPEAKVDHFHQEGAIKKNHSAFFIKTVSYKNQFIFLWKNISDYMIISQHLLWLPYHFTKALLTLNLAFFLGFSWALLKIPQLIFNYQLPASPATCVDAGAKRGEPTINYQLSDKEIIDAFAKQ